jgi:adenosyl cobinamide kinase/adenosyl cobinamide phosphate guanylyltransferase
MSKLQHEEERHLSIKVERSQTESKTVEIDCLFRHVTFYMSKKAIDKQLSTKTYKTERVD